jgi:transcriptional regulator with XRE-family HTH domain
MEMLKDTFRENIIARRKELGLTAKQVADRLEISQPAYSQYETGARTPGLDVVEKISAALKTNAASLLMKREAAAA